MIAKTGRELNHPSSLCLHRHRLDRNDRAGTLIECHPECSQLLWFFVARYRVQPDGARRGPIPTANPPLPPDGERAPNVLPHTSWRVVVWTNAAGRHGPSPAVAVGDDLDR